MHRKWLTNKLNAFRPRNEAESNHLAKLKDFIRLNEFCFNSDHPPTRGLESSDQAGHVTGSAWLLSPDRRKTLLTYHRKLGKWLQLGGHSDNHPNVLETALREACEESGIRSIQALHEDVFDIDVHLVPENHKIGRAHV